MNFFGVGTTEMLIILVVLLVVFGPKDLPEVAKKIGGKVGEFRRIMDSANNEMASMLEAAKKLEDMQGIQPASVQDAALAQNAAPAVIPNTPEATNTILAPSVQTIPDVTLSSPDDQLLSASSSMPNIASDAIIADAGESSTPSVGSH